MKRTKRGYRLAGIGVCIVAALALMMVGLASCGGSTTSKKSTNSSTTKLPPGATTSETQTTAQSTAASSSQPASSATGGSATTTQSATSTTPSAAADLAGGRFTVVNATRPDTNKSVISSSSREVKGDYLQAELTIQNIGDSLVDLSQYSFRLQSPGIAADTYSDYYGTTGTYGAYVSTHVISATLMDFSSLQTVTYKVKEGETVDKVFVFFDLNPESVARNAGVTKDNTSLVIRKVSGTDYGDYVAIPLTGYPD